MEPPASEVSHTQRPKAVLVSCGSFNPPTCMHLRMFDLARYHLTQRGWDVVGQFMSPVGDAYNKPGLASAAHRLRMCELAAETTCGDVAVDTWEAIQPVYTRTMTVLQHVQDHGVAAGLAAAAVSTPDAISSVQHALERSADAHAAVDARQPTSDGGHVYGGLSAADVVDHSKARVMLLCGSDLLASLDVPGLWEAPDELLQRHGAVCIARQGVDVERQVAEGAPDAGSVLSRNREHVLLVHDEVGNTISSSAIRRELLAGRPVRYLIPDPVLQYIRAHGLYTQEAAARPADWALQAVRME